MTTFASVHLSSGEGYAQNIRIGRHALVADEPVAAGGQDAGPAPFALVISGLGACTAITLRMYAGRKQWDLGPLHVDLRLVEEDGKRRIDRVLRFAPSVSPEQRTRYLEIAEKTPITLALKSGFTIETRGETAA